MLISDSRSTSCIKNSNLGSTDISSAGSTVTGAISSLSTQLTRQILNISDYFIVSTARFNLEVSNSYLYRIANIIMLKIEGYIPSGVSGNINIGQISLKPLSTVSCIGYSSDGTMTFVPVTVYYDGDIGIRNAESGKNYTVSIVYCV